MSNKFNLRQEIDLF